MSEPLVYLSVDGNEERVPLSEARIPVLDRGFIFGDGVYEVVPVYDRIPFRIDAHLTRLKRSLAAIEIANPYDDAGWKSRIGELIDGFPGDDQMVYMQVTRGVAKRGHAFPKGIVPTVLMINNPLVLPTDAQRANGVSVVTAIDNRWMRCDIKSISLLGNVLMAQNAAVHEAAETIMFRDGNLTEGSSSNAWIVKGGVLHAPVRDNLILEGIRYGLIAELAQAAGIAFQVGAISRADLESADEFMLSSATKEVLPVTSIDGKPVGNGTVGPIYHALYEGYQMAKKRSRAAAS